MKKNIITFLIVFAGFSSQLQPEVKAEGPIPIINQINQSIYSPESTRPLNNLERDYRTNSEIIRLEQKNKEPEKKEEKVTDSSLVDAASKKEKSKLRNLFKGFVVEW